MYLSLINAFLSIVNVFVSIYNLGWFYHFNSYFIKFVVYQLVALGARTTSQVNKGYACYVCP